MQSMTYSLNLFNIHNYHYLKDILIIRKIPGKVEEFKEESGPWENVRKKKKKK